MIRVGVIGATGYAGAELVRLLSSHPQVALNCLTSRQYAGLRFDQVYPSMAGWVDLTCETFDAHTVASKVDVAFLALPHKLPMSIAPELLEKKVKIIDLSADFRFRDAKTYEEYYQPHAAPQLLERAIYGLSEIYFDQIRTADLVGNPGCYPTSILLPLVPLIRADLIDSSLLIADAKSGVSGAGREAVLATHFCQANESFKAYKVGVHRHTPEIEAILSAQAGKAVDVTFVPHLVPMSRGMESTIYTYPRQGVKERDIEDCLRDFYRGRPFVRICGQTPPDSLNVKGTNCCDIGMVVDPRSRRLVLMSVIDNLVKGAAGQAVQNMNIMMGLNETAGLMATPYPI